MERSTLSKLIRDIVLDYYALFAINQDTSLLYDRATGSNQLDNLSHRLTVSVGNMCSKGV